MPLNIHSFPRAIIHIDGDAFFASCEVAKNPALRGKAVVTGKERGIASSMSYEAKARGVTRAMSLRDIKKICPGVIILPSDYETYSLYSKRMYEIVRRYTEDIEEYSIDECFADITGMRRPNKLSYEEMAMKIKHELDTELGMTFSIGLSVNKVTAKIGSKWCKPSGLTIIPGYSLHLYLAKLPVGKVWGIGPNTTEYLHKLGITTALQFAGRDKDWVKAHFSKPFQEIHTELNGGFVYPLTIGQKHDYASISKTRTFTPPSKDREYIFSQLSKNVENACIKLRRHNLFAKQFTFFLKSQDFRYAGIEVKFSQAVSVPQEILLAAREKFNMLFKPNVEYRATGVVLMGLTHGNTQTIDLFGKSCVIDKIQKIYEAVDKVSEKFGKHTIFLGSSFKALGIIKDKENLASKFRLKGETARKKIGLPFLGEVA